MIRQQTKKRPHLAFAAAVALASGAVAFNPYNPSPASGASIDTILAPMTSAALFEKAQKQCDDLNFTYKVGRASSLIGATTVDFMGASGLANVGLELFNTWFPDNALHHKPIDCSSVAPDSAERARYWVGIRNLVAERGLSLSREFQPRGAERPHKNFVQTFDRSMHVLWGDFQNVKGLDVAFMEAITPQLNAVLLADPSLQPQYYELLNHSRDALRNKGSSLERN